MWLRMNLINIYRKLSHFEQYACLVFTSFKTHIYFIPCIVLYKRCTYLHRLNYSLQRCVSLLSALLKNICRRVVVGPTLRQQHRLLMHEC